MRVPAPLLKNGNKEMFFYWLCCTGNQQHQKSCYDTGLLHMTSAHNTN